MGPPPLSYFSHLYEYSRPVSKRQGFLQKFPFSAGKRQKAPRYNCTGAKKRKFCIGSAQPETAYEICIVVAGGQIAGDDAAVSGGRGVHVLAVADVDTGVGKEEHKT
jgi:hypothetical protein